MSSARSESGPPQARARARRNIPTECRPPTTAPTGCCYFHGRYSVGDDRLWGVNRRKKGATNSLTALKSIRAARPDGAPIYVITDNLSALQGRRHPPLGQEAQGRVVLHPDLRLLGEPDRGAFRTAKAVHHRQLQPFQPHVQTPALHAYLRWRNANARHRDVLAAERQERARIRSKKGIRWGGRPRRAASNNPANLCDHSTGGCRAVRLPRRGHGL